MGFLTPQPKEPAPITPPPTIDEAANEADTQNKLRKRIGVGATILSGDTLGKSSAAQPATAANLLLGR